MLRFVTQLSSRNRSGTRTRCATSLDVKALDFLACKRAYQPFSTGPANMVTGKLTIVSGNCSTGYINLQATSFLPSSQQMLILSAVLRRTGGKLSNKTSEHSIMKPTSLLPPPSCHLRHHGYNYLQQADVAYGCC